VVHSVRWSYAGSTLIGIFQIGFAAVLARLLDPSVFGIVALGNTMVRISQFFSEMGVSSTVIQKRNLSEGEKAVLFNITLASNSLLFLILWSLTPLIADFVQGVTADSVSVIRIMAVSAILTGMGQTAAALMRRDLEFKYLNLYSIGSLIAGQGLVAIPMVYMGWSIWSLVAGNLVQVGLLSILVLFKKRHPLWQGIKRERWRGLWQLSAHFYVLRLLDAIGGYMPYLAVAFLVGAKGVGLFDRAFILVFLPLQYFSFSLSKVLFPAFNRLQHDIDRVQRIFRSVMTLRRFNKAVAQPALLLGGREKLCSQPYGR